MRGFKKHDLISESAAVTPLSEESWSQIGSRIIKWIHQPVPHGNEADVHHVPSRDILTKSVANVAIHLWHGMNRFVEFINSNDEAIGKEIVSESAEFHLLFSDTLLKG
ncbi:Hypothetical protein PENO1_107880 [Penicillium occitanis (nom. inval.)]|nr:Hypothetical protein PENO1_107880 [Penicillium occitanis (nom. inval.)]PCG89012.1 hypothetical protein PENOC_108410 [Penicillium occitanis (nom. inval.)]